MVVTAKAKTRANGKMSQDGCKLNGSIRYNTQVMRIKGNIDSKSDIVCA